MQIGDEVFPISTTTALAAIDSKFDINALFWTCPLDYLSNIRINEKKVSYPGIGNLILGAKYGLYSRGNIRYDKQGFNHSITFLVATSIKNVTLRLSITSIHVSGAQSLDNAKEAVDILINRLQFCYKIQKQIVDLTQKEKCELYNNLAYISKGYSNFVNHCTMTTYCGKWPFKKYEEIGNCLMSYVYDYPNYYNYLDFIDKILNLNSPVIEYVILFVVQSTMFNTKYNLWFPVNRQLLIDHLDQQYGFTVIDQIDSLIIHLPYEKYSDSISKEKKTLPHHSFTITERGSVTQSSPNMEEAQKAYHHFHNTIFALKDKLQTKKIVDLVL
jgi:hypothetical protein